MAKDIKFDKDAREAIKKGMDKLARSVIMTLGPRGRSVAIERSYGAPQVTFDGVSVAKEIELEDKYENLGAQFLKQAADKTADNVGDGTTTSVVLAHSMISEGERVISEKGFNVIKLAEELNKASQAVIAELDKQKELTDDNKKIEEVASISSKDKEVGKLIAEVMEKVGKDGVVTVDDSNAIGNSYEVVEGMQFDRGYISAYMITDQERMEAVLENPYILVTDEKITSINDLLPLLEKVMKGGKKDMVIIAEDVEGEALATLVVNKLRGVFNVLAVKAPGFGDRRKEMLQDIATVTGAELISEDIGKKLETTDVTSLGSAAKVVADKDNTTIVGGVGNADDIAKRVSQLKSQHEKSESDFDKEKLQERIGKLSGGVAVIKIGAATETAQKELKDRVEDAVHATKAAMEDGIVPGGGIALFNSRGFEYVNAEDKEVGDAARVIIEKAIMAPLEAIIENSGGSDKSIRELEKAKESGDLWTGFNAFSNKIDNLKEAGIIDPLKVVKTAFTNAVSVASNYLTLGAAIVEIPKEESPMGGMPPGMGM
ncbi:MAG: chaperonin GroL [Candidatus Colwellbacteria bacterium RIFCSPHIGHO2_02_FULL_45_17]|nr:MAG: chaperonin GroL [Candidatus Colwellbacteria bacterium RIFCSPHIGHO2_02_FULL_45_17]